jgi:hypothetical protein
MFIHFMDLTIFPARFSTFFSNLNTLLISQTRVESVMRAATAKVSNDWLVESRMREKISFDLNQATNLRQLSVLFQYCEKTMLVLLNTTIDMSLISLNKRLKRMLRIVRKMTAFVDDLFDIQNKWLYVFHFVKFSGRGEVGRESPRLFQACSEDMKKIDMSLGNSNNSVYTVCVEQHSSTFNGDEDENEASGGTTSGMLHQLDSIMEDQHSNMQSLLDPFPRFSLLSYNRLAQLYKAWLLGPTRQLSLVSQCFHEMFDGLGLFTTDFSLHQRRFICTGFVSNDSVEKIAFHEGVPFTLRVEEFAIAFERQLRLHMSSSIDALMLSRRQSLRNMLEGRSLPRILANSSAIFSNRITQLSSNTSDEVTNQAFVLANQCSFTEEVWFCFGYTTGAMDVVRPDLKAHRGEIAAQWRSLLVSLLNECKDNASALMGLLRIKREGAFKMKAKKARALISALFTQEIGFVRLLNTMMQYNTCEGAAEHWAGRYQLVHVPNEADRSSYSPFDVTVGCVTTPYGMEYQGGLVRVLCDENVEKAIQMVTGSAACSRATIFVSRDEKGPSTAAFEVEGERAVSCKDVADALGRVFTSLSSVQSPSCVRLFLARLVALDAVGCVDFSLLDSSSLTSVVAGVAQCFSALKEQNFVLLQEWLRYPLKTHFRKTDAQLDRAKACHASLRSKALKMMNNNSYLGMVMVGLATENAGIARSLQASGPEGSKDKDSKSRHNDKSTDGTGSASATDSAAATGAATDSKGNPNNSMILQAVSRSIFDLLSIPHHRPLLDMGILLSLHGFVFGLEIQAICQQTIAHIVDKFGDSNPLVRHLCSSAQVRHLSVEAGQALLVRLVTEEDNTSGQDRVARRLRVEIESFTSCQWETVLLTGSDHRVPMKILRHIMFTHFQDRLNMLLPRLNMRESEALKVPGHVVLERCIGANTLVVSAKTRMAISQSARQYGVIAGQAFLDSGARLWSMMSNRSNCLAILSGDQACGKTVLRNVIINTISKLGPPSESLHAGGGSLHNLRSMEKVLQVAEKWLVSHKRKKLARKHKEEREKAEKAELARRSKEEEAEFKQKEADMGSGSLDVRKAFRSKEDSRAADNSSEADPQLHGNEDDDMNAAAGFDDVGGEDEQHDAHLNSFGPHATKVYVNVIYHASLDSDHLLGKFDDNMNWHDGLLIRKLRDVDEFKHKLRKDAAEQAAEADAVHILVLDGPLGFHLEQLFSASHVQCSGTSTLRHDTFNSRLNLPSGELYHLSSQVLILLETSDVQQASPPLLAHTPHLHLTVAPDVQCRHIVKVWCASIRNWLGHFLPYIDMLDYMDSKLTETNFLLDLLHFDEGVLQVSMVSRLSGFFRIMEELLVQMHHLAIAAGTFVAIDKEDWDTDEESADASDDEEQAGGRQSSDSDSDGGVRGGGKTPFGGKDDSATKDSNDLVHDFNKVAMTLSPRERDKLMARVKIVIAYSAAWGIGGVFNGSNQAKIFDSVVRDAIEEHIGTEPNIADSNNINIFDLTLSLEHMAMVPAMTMAANKFGVPKSFEDQHIDCYIDERLGSLCYKTRGHIAVTECVKVLMSSGAHVMVAGGRGCGKTRLVRDLLADLETNCATPQHIRDNIVQNLMKIVTSGTNYNEGIGAALSKMRQVCQALVDVPPIHDDKTDFGQCWNMVQMQLLDLLTKGARAHCSQKTVFSTSTSIRAASKASDLRKWVEESFRTEVDNVLETPRYNHGVCFVDDLHLSAASDSASTDLLRGLDAPQSFLKAMLDVFPISGISRNLASLPVNAHYGGKPDGSMPRQMYAHPVIHRPLLTDPRRRVMTPDNFIMQRVGFVSCATTNPNSPSSVSGRDNAISGLSKHFAVINLPTFTSTHIHMCLIAGANVALEHGLKEAKSVSNVVNVLRPEIAELSRIVLLTASKMIGSGDASHTTNLEKSLRNMISLDVSTCAKFCMCLGNGAPSVSNKGSLLELYVHEWERIFLDPLPDGNQRARLISQFTSGLHDIDVSGWYISDDWLNSIMSRVGSPTAPVWANARLMGNTITGDDDDFHALGKRSRRATAAARGNGSLEDDDESADLYVFCSMFFLLFLFMMISLSLSSIYYCLPAFSDTT